MTEQAIGAGDAVSRAPTGSRGARAGAVADPPRPTGNAARAWRRFRENKLALSALVLAVALVAFALAAPWVSAVTGVGPTDQALANQFASPSWEHPLGTDEYGRDVLTRAAYGGRVSLGVAILAVAVMLALGTLVGAVAALFGGWADGILMRFVDVMLCIPTFYVLLLVSSVIKVGPAGLAVTIALFGWFGLARLVRAELLSVRERDFVVAARMLGAGSGRILIRHLLPNVLPRVVVLTTTAIPGFIVAEAGLSYLGLGVLPPTPSWGNMLNNSAQYLYSSKLLIVVPGACVWLTVLSLTIVGNALRDALDPRLS